MIGLQRSLQLHRLLIGLAALQLFAPLIVMADSGDESDAVAGRLSGEAYQFVIELTRRGMPELVEEYLKDKPPACRIHVARAYRRAGVDAPPGAEQERFLAAAEAHYRQLIAREPKDLVSASEWVAFHFAQCRVELAELLLKHRLSVELDRLEMTSGLAFDRERLIKGLTEVRDLYHQARQEINRLLGLQRSMEERFMLLGMTRSLRELSDVNRTGLAWSSLYCAAVAEADDPKRDGLLTESLAEFDSLVESAAQPPERFAAMIGKGMALRERGLLSDAEATLNRVLDGATSPALSARAKHEQARILIAMARWREARVALKTLAEMPMSRFRGDDTAGAFYVRLAPVLHAWTWICEARAGAAGRSPGAVTKPVAGEGGAKSPPGAGNSSGSATFDDLRDRAIDELEQVARMGPAWESLARIYLERIAPAGGDPAGLSDTALRLAADELLSREEFGKAATLLRVLMARDQDSQRGHEAQFNLGVCLFRLNQLGEARQLFESVAEADRGILARQAAEHAYRVAKQIAVESKTPDDCRALVRAARRLVKRSANHPLAAEADWSAALALQEIEAFDEAAVAFEGIGAQSPHYERALRGAAVSRQRQFEMAESHEGGEAHEAAVLAADSWLKYARYIESKQVKANEPEPEAVAAKLSAARIRSSKSPPDDEATLAALTGLDSGVEVLAIRWQSQRRLGRTADATATLKNLLKTPGDEESAGVLFRLVDEVRTEVERIRSAGRTAQAAALAGDGVLLAERLCGLCIANPKQQHLESAARFVWARFLADTKQSTEALAQLDRLITRAPDNGEYLALAATLYEREAESGPSQQRAVAADRAEKLWARLLEDGSLRESRASLYWNARFHWLRHQLRQERAGDVVRGIESERAWYPDLGGPPWQGRLLELLDEARRSDKTNQP